MTTGRIGVSLWGSSPTETVELIEKAESIGVPAVWLTTGGAGPDALTIFAAAAARTSKIRMGTSIVPIFPRHPLVMVQQAQVVANLAPGRLVLGVGTSHEPQVTTMFGLPFDQPLDHLREYVTVVKASLKSGQVDFDGKHYHAHAKIFNPAEVPVMISALRAGSFRLAGEMTDGAITWICPAAYIRDVALPALREGAAQAGRQAPPLVGHCFVAVGDDPAENVRAARGRIGQYPRLPFYARMFEAAGFPEAQKGEWSEGMFDAVVIHGGEEKVADGLRAFLATSGADELIASIVAVGPDTAASTERAMRLIAAL